MLSLAPHHREQRLRRTNQPRSTGQRTDGAMIVMNWRMKPICHRLVGYSKTGSTLQSETATCEVSPPPSITPSFKTARSFSSRMILRSVFRHIHAIHHGDADIRSVQ